MTLPFVLCIQHWPPNSSKCFGCEHSCLRAFAHTHHGLHFSQHIHRNINREAECGIHGKRKVNGLNKSSTLSMEKKAQPTPIFLSGKSHGQRSMVGYSPRGHKSWTQFSDFTTTTRCPICTRHWASSELQRRKTKTPHPLRRELGSRKKTKCFR